MRCQQRRKQLLELVRLRRFASLPELVEELGVSESTIRRDLDYLEELGSARRTHGGVLYAGDLPKFPHFEMRQPADWPKKRAIAQRTAELIADGESILLDGGSTTYEVARLLVGRPIHVVTNSLPVANLLAADTRADLVLVGGNVCPRTGVVLGPYADRMLASIRVRKAILSVAAINEDGFFNNNLLLVETERAMMRAANEVIVVADSSKFGHQSLAHLCRLGEVNYLVVDSQIDPQWREKVLAAGVELLVAQSSV